MLLVGFFAVPAFQWLKGFIIIVSKLEGKYDLTRRKGLSPSRRNWSALLSRLDSEKRFCHSDEIDLGKWSYLGLTGWQLMLTQNLNLPMFQCQWIKSSDKDEPEELKRITFEIRCWKRFCDSDEIDSGKWSYRSYLGLTGWQLLRAQN